MSIGESHDSPDAGVGSVGSLVGALVLGDLVLGVDEAAVWKGVSLGPTAGSITRQSKCRVESEGAIGRRAGGRLAQPAANGTGLGAGGTTYAILDDFVAG